MYEAVIRWLTQLLVDHFFFAITIFVAVVVGPFSPFGPFGLKTAEAVGSLPEIEMKKLKLFAWPSKVEAHLSAKIHLKQILFYNNTGQCIFLTLR